MQSPTARLQCRERRPVFSIVVLQLRFEARTAKERFCPQLPASTRARTGIRPDNQRTHSRGLRSLHTRAFGNTPSCADSRTRRNRGQDSPDIAA